jgi:hypothetical protein
MRIPEHRRLADPGLAANDERPASASARPLEQLVDPCALRLPSNEHCRTNVDPQRRGDKADSSGPGFPPKRVQEIARSGESARLRTIGECSIALAAGLLMFRTGVAVGAPGASASLPPSALHCCSSGIDADGGLTAS